MASKSQLGPGQGKESIGATQTTLIGETFARIAARFVQEALVAFGSNNGPEVAPNWILFDKSG